MKNPIYKYITMLQYYNNIPENFLGQKTKKSKKNKKKKKISKKLGLGHYYRNQTQSQAWAITTNTIPGLLTKQKNLLFENRVLTNTIPRSKREIEATRKFVNNLAWSQERVHSINKRLLIDEDDPVRRNLIRDFNEADNRKNRHQRLLNRISQISPKKKVKKEKTGEDLAAEIDAYYDEN